MTTFGIIGTGKMGQAIIEILECDQNASFHPFTRLSEANLDVLKACDAAIEFTLPEAAPGVIRQCLEAGVPVVSGTTGWHENQLDPVINLCHQLNGKFLYSSNFSIGMNITFALNRRIAKIMNQFPEFTPSIREMHHIHKKDSPSGTALTLIQDLLNFTQQHKGYDLNSEHPNPEKIQVTAIREGEIKGFHQISWQSDNERIQIIHEAFDRKIFAQGAILAARWLIDQSPGGYTMKDIIDL